MFSFLLPRDLDGIHYAVRIFIGTSMLWFLLQKIGDTSPLWAIISLIVVTEPKMELTLLNFKARIVNTTAGCIMGLFFLLFFRHQNWLLPFALTVSVLVSSYVIRRSLGWRIAPITTAIVIAAGMGEQSAVAGLDVAMHRVLEVFFGSAMAVAVSWLMSRLWPASDDLP